VVWRSGGFTSSDCLEVLLGLARLEVWRSDLEALVFLFTARKKRQSRVWFSGLALGLGFGTACMIHEICFYVQSSKIPLFLISRFGLVFWKPRTSCAVLWCVVLLEIRKA